MSNALATQQGGALATSNPNPTAQQILSTDILIPKLLLMQGQSEFVKERKARDGDFVRSTTVETLGGPEQGISFIPLKMTTEWREEERVGQKFEFRRTIPRTPANEHNPWSFWRNAQGMDFDKPGQLGATEWRRVKVLNCFALLPTDIDAFDAEMAKAAESGEMPDLTKTVLPLVISFRSTSFNAGKQVATFFAQVEEMRQHVPNVKPYAYTLPLGCKLDKNDQGSFYIFQVGQPKKLDPKYLAQAERWFNTLNSMKEVRIDESGERETPVEGGSF